MSEEQGDSDGEEVAEAVGEVAEGVGKVVDAASKAQRGDAAGAIGSGLSAAGSAADVAAGALGEDEAEAREALETASSVASAATSALAAGQSLAGAAQSGQAGQAARGAGAAADTARYVVPDNEAQQVLDGGGQGARALGGAVEGLGELGSALGGGRHTPVSFHLEVDGLGGALEVRDVQVHESLNEVSACRVVFLSDEHTASSDLLRKECRLTVERDDQIRTFGGIVQHASVRGDLEGTRVTVRIVPALWYLSQIVTSRVHQHTTVPELVLALVDELLGTQHRSARDDTTATYPQHEYLVQYEESYLDFVSRLCEQEGIFWYFDHSEEPEVMVLADAESSLPSARDGDSDEVPYIALEANNEEGVHTADHDQRVGPSDAVISGFDWTRPRVAMGDERTGRSDEEPALEIYDHTEALTYHRYEEPAYGEDTASIQVQMRTEMLDLARQDWSMGSTFIGARPGHVFELVNCPDGDLNGRYMIVGASSSGSANGRDTGTYGSSLRCVPTSLPYRPERRTPRPVIPGLQSATVVTDGQEIQTDLHGRVKVQFHWDRLGQNDDRSSCWLRVVHNWAGEGFGTFFLPRRDMEVVVGFLGGNPDQPIITGCVYNGANPVPTELDAKRTQSVIRTRSSPDSDGFNELRFEDEAGSEFIYTHAQKDYNEEVENDHSTHVKHDQSNTVDNDQTETVGNNQTMTVHGERTKTVDEDETNTVHKNRVTTVDENDTETIGGDRTLHVEGNETVTIDKDRKLHVIKKTVQNHDDGRQITVGTYDQLKVDGGANRNVHVTGQFNTKIDDHYVVEQGGTEKVYLNGHIYISSDSKIELMAPGCKLKMADGKIELDANSEITFTSGGASVAIKSDGTVELVGSTKVGADGGGSTMQLTADGVKSQGNMFEATANAVMTLTGTMIKLN